MKEWKKYKLGEILTIKYGKDHKKLEDGPIPVYGSGGLMRSVNSYICDTPSILIPRKGSLNNVMYVEHPFWTVDTMFWTIIDTTVAVPRFVYYAICKIDFESLNVGSAVPSMTVPIIEDIEIYLPSLDEQNRIVKVLSSLESKIEVNRQINDNLEKELQALYWKYFSNTQTINLGDVVQTTSGGTPSRTKPEYYGGEYKWVKSKELNSSFLIDTEESITTMAIKKSAAKLLPEKSILIAMYGATVGEYAIIAESMTCNQAICALIPNEQYPYTYLYMVAKNKKEELINKAIGSAQQNISQVLIRTIKVSKENNKIRDFHRIALPFFEIIEKKQKENSYLSNIRDIVLPKLISGELKINEINC